MSDDAVDGRIGFEVDGRTLCIRDALEGESLSLRFDRELQPQPALTDLFPVPVDRAVSFEAESVSILGEPMVVVRDADGEFVEKLGDGTDLPRETYYVDVNGVTKALIRIPNAEVSAAGTLGTETVELTFDRPTTVTVGARSLHTRPEATITVPDDPSALAEAVSVLGSSIKEFTPERSWPTLRGYPPRIRVGDELDIPSPLVSPDTGVEVVVRPTYEDLYRLSTLAYYLGARVVVGDAPAIRLDTGYAESLPTEGVALEERAEELLRTWFFLDTLARTEGYIKSDRFEYELVGPELPFYPPKLADLSMSERLMEYLEVDPTTVAPYTPEWPTEAVLRPLPECAELLPHLAHVLAPVRVRGSSDPTANGPIALAAPPWTDYRDGDAGGSEAPVPDGSSFPAGTTMLTTEGYENWLVRAKKARGEVRAVVLTDSAERAAELRRTLSDPAVPSEIGAWEVLDRPNSDTVRTTLSDSTVDIAYCSLPTKQDGLVAADGTVSLDDLGAAPALVVFENDPDPSLGTSVIENGGLSAILTEDALDPGSARALVGLLSFGVSTAASVGLSGVGDETRTRIVGAPGIEISSHNILAFQVNSARSESPTAHRIERGSILSLTGQIGGEQQLNELFQSKVELTGRTNIDGPTVDSSELWTLLNQDDVVLRLNGRLLLPDDIDEEADIERLARRHLSRENDPAEGVSEHCSE
ncbi:hypothetical protein [Halorubrum sp. FL23]|uniref:hypothetical protein n=1 Tax=Halorubrum sp. FL23 TaxID=3458704 RepID=UPI0040339668